MWFLAFTSFLTISKYKMTALKGMLLTSTAHLSKIVLGLVLIKLIALYLGPDGLGRLGHYMSLVSIVILLAGGGITNGIIKYISVIKSDSDSLNSFISSVFVYSLFFSLIVFVVGVFFSGLISTFIFGGEDLYWVVFLLCAAQIGFAFNNIVTGLCSGLGKIRVFSTIQIVGNLSAIPISWLIIEAFGFKGAIVAYLLSFLICIIPSLYFYNSLFPSKAAFLFGVKEFENFKLLYPYSLMLLTSASSVPVVEILIRELIILTHGIQSAGFWQGAVRLSSAYIGFFGVFLSYYFVPLISQIDCKATIKLKVNYFLKVVGLIFVIGGLGFYLGRSYFVPILLSEEFSPLIDFLGFQLLGDFFKVLSYVIGFVLVAKAAAKLYIFAEIFQSSLLFFCVYYFNNSALGVKGVYVAYFLSSTLYFIIALICFLLWVNIKPDSESVEKV